LISVFVNKKQLTSGSIPSPPPSPRRDMTFVVENDVKHQINKQIRVATFFLSLDIIILF